MYMSSFFSELFSIRGAKAGIVSVLGMLSLFLLVQTLSSLSNIGRAGVPATDVITVQASGQATLPPDIAHISYSVTHTALTVSKAQEAATAQSAQAVAFLSEHGIAKKDLKTLSYSIAPQYEYESPCPYGNCPRSSTPRITGYQVSETVQVTVRDLPIVGEILSGLGKLEVQNVSGPNFGLDDDTAGYNAAREDAIEKAKEQADELSDQLGVSLGKIVNFSESSGYYPMYSKYGMGGMMEANVFSASAPDIQPGENTYSASVSITYEIR